MKWEPKPKAFLKYVAWEMLNSKALNRGAAVRAKQIIEDAMTVDVVSVGEQRELNMLSAGHWAIKYLCKLKCFTKLHKGVYEMTDRGMDMKDAGEKYLFEAMDDLSKWYRNQQKMSKQKQTEEAGRATDLKAPDPVDEPEPDEPEPDETETTDLKVPDPVDEPAPDETETITITIGQIQATGTPKQCARFAKEFTG